MGLGGVGRGEGGVGRGGAERGKVWCGVVGKYSP